MRPPLLIKKVSGPVHKPGPHRFWGVWLHDVQGSVVALLTAAGYLAERIRYTPYGDAVVRANYGDLDDSGFVNAADFNALAGVYLSTMKDNPTVYILNADFDADGKINAGDFNILSGHFATSPEPVAGALSTVGNTIGYAGYVWDAALGGNTSGMYLARNRWYSTNQSSGQKGDG